MGILWLCLCIALALTVGFMWVIDHVIDPNEPLSFIDQNRIYLPDSGVTITCDQIYHNGEYTACAITSEYTIYIDIRNGEVIGTSFFFEPMYLGNVIEKYGLPSRIFRGYPHQVILDWQELGLRIYVPRGYSLYTLIRSLYFYKVYDDITGVG
jgi:hypothetical protein